MSSGLMKLAELKKRNAEKKGLLARVSSSNIGDTMKNTKTIIERNGIYSINDKIVVSEENLDPELKALVDSVLRS